MSSTARDMVVAALEANLPGISVLDLASTTGLPVHIVKTELDDLDEENAIVSHIAGDSLLYALSGPRVTAVEQVRTALESAGKSGLTRKELIERTGASETAVGSAITKWVRTGRLHRHDGRLFWQDDTQREGLSLFGCTPGSVSPAMMSVSPQWQRMASLPLTSRPAFFAFRDSDPFATVEQVRFMVSDKGELVIETPAAKLTIAVGDLRRLARLLAALDIDKATSAS